MTKNGFIYALKASGCLYHNGQTYYEENELIRTFEDMEMFEEDKALSQEPCTDAVSREDRIIDLANAIESDDSGYWTNKRISSALRNISSVTHKSGKWIYRRGDKYSCSKCSTTTSVDEAGIDEKPMYKFCPYCGAKMESEEV